MNVKNNFKSTYVSRAEGKLAGAVRAFSYDFRNKTVLDIGSSTGGFTELALKLGAKKVIAVEKGTRQMKAPLRFDSRIELHEKTDFFNTERANQNFSGPRSNPPVFTGDSHCESPAGDSGHGPEKVLISFCDTILADVSFVSLKKILAHAKQFAGVGTDFLVMLKPQFEARETQMTRGVVKNEKIRREIVKDFEIWLKNNGFLITKKRDNDFRGRNGNLERFYWLKLAK